jgi:hypothetical protein
MWPIEETFSWIQLENTKKIPKPFLDVRWFHVTKTAAMIFGTIGTTAIFSLLFLWCCNPTRSMAFSIQRFLGHAQRSITVGRTLLHERLARCWDLYLPTHNTHNRKTFMPPAILTRDLSRRGAVAARLLLLATALNPLNPKHL